MLVPAGVMVLMMLGVLAVDSAIAFMAKRELQNLAVSAANDAVAVAIPQDSLARDGSRAQIDMKVAEELVHRRMSVSPLSNLQIVEVGQPTIQEDRFVVEARGRVRYLFARAVPGAADTQDVIVRASARLDQQ